MWIEDARGGPAEKLMMGTAAMHGIVNNTRCSSARWCFTASEWMACLSGNRIEHSIVGRLHHCICRPAWLTFHRPAGRHSSRWAKTEATCRADNATCVCKQCYLSRLVIPDQACRSSYTLRTNVFDASPCHRLHHHLPRTFCNIIG